MDFLEFFNLQEPGRKYEDHEVVQFYVTNPDMKVKDVAAKVGRTIPELYRVLQRHGQAPTRLNVNRQMVLDFCKSGYTVGQIADMTGYTPRNVRYIIGSEE